MNAMRQWPSVGFAAAQPTSNGALWTPTWPAYIGLSDKQAIVPRPGGLAHRCLYGPPNPPAVQSRGDNPARPTPLAQVDRDRAAVINGDDLLNQPNHAESADRSFHPDGTPAYAACRDPHSASADWHSGGRRRRRICSTGSAKRAYPGSNLGETLNLIHLTWWFRWNWA